MHEVLDHKVNENICSISSNRESLILFVCKNHATKQVSEDWKKEWGGEMFRECTAHNAGHLILFRKGVSYDVLNLAYESKRIQSVNCLSLIHI